MAEEKVVDVKKNPLYKKFMKKPYRELGLRMRELQEDIKTQEDATKVLKAEFDLIRLIVIPDRFLEEGITSQNLTGVGRLGITGDMHCNQDKNKVEEFYAWMEENGFGDLIKPSVNASSLKALIKSLRESEDEDEQRQWAEIQDYVKVHPFSRASITKPS